MSAERCLESLLKGIRENAKNIEVLEDNVSDKIEEVSKLKNFTELPLENVKRILAHSGPISTELAISILSSFSKKYGGDTCILLKSLRLHDASLESMTQCLSAIKGSHFCEKMNSSGVKELQRIRKHISHLEKETISFRAEIQRLRAILGHNQDIRISMHKPEMDTERDDKGMFDSIRRGEIGRVKRILMDDPTLIEVEGTDDITPLIYSAFYGQTEIAQYLIDNGANIESKDAQDNTPLLTAAAAGEIDMVKLLLANRANKEATNILKRTPLVEAITNVHDDVALYLLDNEVNIENVDRTGSTPLLIAAQWGNLPVVQELVRLGANVNAVDPMGTTALMRAARAGYLEIVNFLLNSGANVSLVNKDGKSAFDFAYSIEVRKAIHAKKHSK